MDVTGLDMNVLRKEDLERKETVERAVSPIINDQVLNLFVGLGDTN